MTIHGLSRAILVGLAATLLLLPPLAFSDDATPPPSDAGDERDAQETDGERKFDSRTRLARTVFYNDYDELRDQQESLDEAEALLQRAIDADAPQETIDRIQAEVDRREQALDDAKAANDRVAQQIEDLSDEQVFAYNRSLNNAISSKLLDYLDTDLLKRSLFGDLDRKQINNLTQALEQEARFTMKADRLRDRAEETGNDRLLAKADKMEDRGEAQKDKFLARISGTSESATSARSAVREEGKRQARSAARDAAKQEARRIARSTAREEARELARAIVRDHKDEQEFKREAVQIARAAVREEARANRTARPRGKQRD